MLDPEHHTAARGCVTQVAWVNYVTPCCYRDRRSDESCCLSLSVALQTTLGNRIGAVQAVNNVGWAVWVTQSCCVRTLCVYTLGLFRREQSEVNM